MTYGGASLKILMTSGRGTREENKKSRFKNKKKIVKILRQIKLV